jgi:hypothetical protein
LKYYDKHVYDWVFSSRSSGGIVNGLPTVCGGYDSSLGMRNLGISKCFQFDPARNMWNVSGNMQYGRTWTGYDSDEDWGLVIVGGYSDPNLMLKSVERTKDGRTFSMLAPIPQEIAGLCLAIIDSSTIFIAGGKSYQWNTLMEAHIMRNNEWTRVQNMRQ